MILSRILMVSLLVILAYIVYITMNCNESFSNNKTQENFAHTTNGTKQVSFAPTTNVTTEPSKSISYNAIMNNQLSQTNSNPLQNLKLYAPSQTLSSENKNILNTNIDKLVKTSDTVTNLKSNIENHQDTILGVKINEANKYYKPDGSIVQGTEGIIFDVKDLTDVFPKDVNDGNDYYKSAKSDTILQYNPQYSMKNVTGAIFGNMWSDTNNIGGNSKNRNSEFSYATITDMKGIPSDKEYDPASLLIDSSNFLCAPLCNNLYYTNSISNINKNSSQDLRGDICVKFNNAGNMFNNSTIYGEPMIINRLGDCTNTIPQCML